MEWDLQRTKKSEEEDKVATSCSENVLANSYKLFFCPILYVNLPH